MPTSRRISRTLGAFSLGLGAIQLIAPRRFTRVLGASAGRDSDRIVRLVGARELLAAVPLLGGRRPVAALWMRVGGDIMDLALVGMAMRGKRASRGRLAAAGVAGAAITALDVAAASMTTGTGSATAAIQGGPPTVRRSVTVLRDRDEVYATWRRLSDLPRFMGHLEEVTELDGRRSHWRAKGPAGTSVEWDAELIEDVPGREVAWRSLPDADVHHAGMVTFRDAPGGRGTEIHVLFEYAPPGGPLGATVAKLFGEEPAQQVGADLARFKQLMELGDVVESDATVGERKLRQRPAQPTAREEATV